MKEANQAKGNTPRINLACYEDHLEFCKEMAWRNRMSVTEYINSLIAQEKEKHDPAEWKSAEKE